MVHYGEESMYIESNLEGYKNVRWGGFRLLEVDQRLFVPQNIHVTFLITSTDVLHSWAIPSFGIKLDACPGRLAHITLYFPREGTFYGQCSEICGAGHGFMPIVVRVVDLRKWLIWSNYEK
jgi:cytochrome c oxidase subunit 2